MKNLIKSNTYILCVGLLCGALGSTAVQGAYVSQSPDMVKSLLAEGSQAVSGTPADFAAHLTAEKAQWSRVVKAAGIRGTL